MVVPLLSTLTYSMTKRLFLSLWISTVMVLTLSLVSGTTGAGIRRSRSGTALVFYKLMQWMGVNIVKNHADYRLVGRKALEALATYGETNLFLRGIFATMGFRIEQVPFDVKERHAGISKYSFSKMLALAFNGITSFSIVPLRIVTVVGFLVFLASTVMSLYVFYVAMVEDKVVPGWASTVLPIYFLGGVQLLSIGLLGEYIGRIYSETKARPRFIRDSELF